MMNPRRPTTARSTSTTAETSASTSYLLDDRPLHSRSGTARPGSTRHKTGTKTTSTGLAGDQQIVCALTESRGISPTVGLAFVNLSTTEAVLCQIVDNQTYVKTLHKLHVFEPSEILIVSTSFAPSKSKLLQILEANLVVETTITALGRKFWDETAGLDYIHNLAFKEDVEAVKVSIGGNFYATCCLAAVSSITS
jgi:DNA mismatch repair protein MSH4